MTVHRRDPSGQHGPSEPPAPRYDGGGLVPAVVQDAADGRVLMLAYMDEEALAATLATGEVHFHSRSRGRLWRKGETSGHVLHLAGLALDCDRDAILIQAIPGGPTCHRGTRSCFDPEDGPPETDQRSGAADPGPPGPPAQGFAWLESLWTTIEQRRVDRPAGSYTAGLLEGGVDAVGRKVTEEATEVLLAARDDAEAERDAARASRPEAAGAGVGPSEGPGSARTSARTRARTALAGEAADLLYHLLVLLAERDVPPSAVIETLAARHRA